jgi:DNA-binding response OmpR family regulator
VKETISQSGKEDQLLSSTAKHIIIVDDESDITLTFKRGLKAENVKDSNLFFDVRTYNDPFTALSEFKPHFYDLLLIDVNMPGMDGFEFASKIIEQDANVRVCFVTATEINIQALKEQRPSLSLGCFIKKPVSIENLVSKVKAELE